MLSTLKVGGDDDSPGGEIQTRTGIEQFTTHRMIAERLRSIHYPEARRLHLHPQVIKTLSLDGQLLPVDVTKDGLLQNEAHWAEHGFGLWIFRSKEDGRFIGRGGLHRYQSMGMTW